MTNKDIFLSSYLNKECFIVTNLKSFNRILKSTKNKKNIFITLKSNKKLSNFAILKNNLKFISKLFLFKYNLTHNKKIKINDSLSFTKAKNIDWLKIKKIIPKKGTSRVFQDLTFKKKLREKYLFNWIKNFFLGKRGDNLILCKNQKKQILGFALLRKLKNKVIVDQLLISKFAQGQGIGTQLLKIVNTKFSKKPTISGVHSFNTGGISFYSTKLKCKIINESYYYHFHKTG